MATKKKQKLKPQPPATPGLDLTFLAQRYEDALLSPVDPGDLYYDEDNPRVEPDIEADNKGRAFLAWRLAEERRRMRGGRAKDTGNALTRLIRAYRGRHRQATQDDVLAYLRALTRRRKSHPVVQAVTEREDDDYLIEWSSQNGEHSKPWSDIRHRWNNQYRPAGSKSEPKSVKRPK